jgi:hypothetical protein
MRRLELAREFALHPIDMIRDFHFIFFMHRRTGTRGFANPKFERGFEHEGRSAAATT